MDKTERMIEELCRLARQNLVYLTFGEWDGSPKDLNDLDMEELLRMQFILNFLVNKKFSEQE